MDTNFLTIEQFSRKFVKGFEPPKTVKDGKWDRKVLGTIKLKQPDGSIALSPTWFKEKAEAIKRLYREYQFQQAHFANLASMKPSKPVILAADHDHPYQHLGCGGSIAYEFENDEAIPLPNYPHAYKGFCQKCYADGYFQLSDADQPGSDPARFAIAENEPLIRRIPFTGRVNTETSFTMLREDVMAGIKRALAVFKDEHHINTKMSELLMLCLEIPGDDDRQPVYMGVEASFLYYLVEVMDAGQLISFAVDTTEKKAVLEYGASKSTLKLFPPMFKKNVTTGSGRSARTRTVNVTLLPFAMDFEATKSESNLDSWIAKALPTGACKTYLVDNDMGTYLFHWGNHATDGYRIHYDKDLEVRSHPNKKIEAHDIKKFFDMFKSVDPCATFSRKAATKALKVGKIGEGVVIEFTSKTMTFTGSDALNTLDSSIPCKSKFTGKIRINPTFLTKALSGMDEDVEIVIHAAQDGFANQMILVRSGGSRSAVISLMKLED